MLLRLILKNFLSFDEEMQFDMFPNMKRTSLSDHVYVDRGEIPVLKQAAIFGANGAGKSNLIKALEFIREFVIRRDFLKQLELSKFFYLMKDNATERPICLSVEFESAKRYYLYEIEIGLKGVEREALSETFPAKGDMELVFERQKTKVTYGKAKEVDSAIAEATSQLLAKNTFSSLLSLNREFPIVSDSRCNIAYKWFNGQLVIIGVNTFLPTLIDLLHKNKDMMSFARQLVLRLEVGVKDFMVEESDFDEWAKTHSEIAKQLPANLEHVENLSLNQNNKPILSIDIEKGVRKVYQMMFENIGKNGFVGRLDASMQSDGTLRALTLLPALYNAIKQQKTVVVDEINFCLSPTMVRGLVAFFAQDKTSNGQLIFTTHDTQLLDEKNILRSDEIWFVDKNEGTSVIYSHNDFKEHHTLSVMKGYNEGRYGAIRFVNLKP